MKIKNAGVISIVLGIFTGMLFLCKWYKKHAVLARQYSEKHLAMFQLMNDWMITKQDGKSIQTCLNKKGYHTIAIYGMGDIGERLYDELKNTDICVKYAIDQFLIKSTNEIPVVKPDEKLTPVDAVIVTPVTMFEQIKSDLIKKIDCPILSIEDLLYEL